LREQTATTAGIGPQSGWFTWLAHVLSHPTHRRSWPAPGNVLGRTEPNVVNEWVTECRQIGNTRDEATSRNNKHERKQSEGIGIMASLNYFAPKDLRLSCPYSEVLSQRVFWQWWIICWAIK